MLNLGVVRPGSTIRIPFSTFDKDDGSSITMTNYAAADVLCYKDGSTTERASTNGFTATTDFDSKTGKHLAVIDLADNTTSGFWNAGSEYLVAIDAVTVDGVTTGGWIARFTIGYQGANLDTTIASLSSQTSFTLTAGPAEDDALNGHWAIIHDIASAVQRATVLISDYVGSTKTVTLAAGATFTAAAGDNISVMDLAPLQPAVLGRTLAVGPAGQADPLVREITDRFYAMLEPAPGSPNEFRWSADALQRVQTVLGFAAGNADAQLAALLAAVATRASQSSVDTLAGYVDTEVAAILAAVQLIQIVTDKLGTTLQSAPGSPGEYRFTEDSLEMAPAGTGGGGGGPSAGAIAQAVWDEILSGHVAAGSAGLIVQVAAGVLAKLDTTVEPAGGSPGEYKLTADALRAVIDRVLLVKADTASALTAIDAVPTNSELATALAAADDAVLAAIAALSIPTAIQNADALLNRDMSAVSDTNARTPLNALRFLRNKWAVAGSTLTVKKEDDTTDAWTATVSTTPGADPVTGNDPA